MDTTMKNIFILTGSPRRGGNSDLMADAFARGASEAGHKITKYITANHNIRGYWDCKQCYKTDKACVFDDDFNELAVLIEKADVLVFATPLYWFSFPTQLKSAIDRMISLVRADRLGQIKKTALLACAATENAADFDALVTTYERITDYLHWTDVGQLLITEVYEANDILKTDALLKAQALGKNI
jgi:multimeric flavodoxin WrbA